MDELSFEDREIVMQVMGAVRPTLTQRQAECLLWQLAGFTQREVGEALGISHVAVGHHFRAALRKVGEIAPQYLPTG